MNPRPSSSKKTIFSLAAGHNYIAYDNISESYLNLAGRYGYLELPYYISQELEHAGKQVQPSCKDMLDAYVTPILLEKARLSGLPVPEFFISNGYFEAPVIVDPINPFMIKCQVVLKQSQQERVAKSKTRNFTYAICCQSLPPNARVKYFRSVMGWCIYSKYRALSEMIWRVFKLPLARVRIIQLENGDALLSDIASLPFDKLNQRELDYIEERVRWGE
jgi:hypothetical protein